MTAPQAGDSGAPLAQPVDSLGGWARYHGRSYAGGGRSTPWCRC